jgi:hypothetical protein
MYSFFQFPPQYAAKSLKLNVYHADDAKSVGKESLVASVQCQLDDVMNATGRQLSLVCYVGFNGTRFSVDFSGLALEPIRDQCQRTLSLLLSL